MGCTLYKVSVDGVTVAERMPIEHALILVKALFNEYYNDSSMSITIREMERTEGEEAKESYKNERYVD